MALGTPSSAIQAARREAQQAFGNGTLFVERLIQRPFHVEVQIFADTHAADGIRMNNVLPGWIDTALTRGARQQVEGLHERVLARTPAARWGGRRRVRAVVRSWVPGAVLQRVLFLHSLSPSRDIRA